MPNVLFVVSAANKWTLKDGTEHPTGFWAEELAEPHRLFSEAGWDIAIATPGGVTPTLDRISIGLAGGTHAKRQKIVDYLSSIKEQIDNPLSLEKVNQADYDLVFYPGGHGPMEDLAVDTTSGKLLVDRMSENRPVALLCHAPAAVLAAETNTGNAFKGYKMTGLSNAEEKMNSFGRKAKWYLEDRLKESGIDYQKNLIPLTSKVVVDRNVYTGQNPQSSVELAQTLIKALS